MTSAENPLELLYRPLNPNERFVGLVELICNGNLSMMGAPKVLALRRSNPFLLHERLLTLFSIPTATHDAALAASHQALCYTDRPSASYETLMAIIREKREGQAQRFLDAIQAGGLPLPMRESPASVRQYAVDYLNTLLPRPFAEYVIVAETARKTPSWSILTVGEEHFSGSLLARARAMDARMEEYWQAVEQLAAITRETMPSVTVQDLRSLLDRDSVAMQDLRRRFGYESEARIQTHYWPPEQGGRA